jgi:hypothetical protein
LPLFPQGKMIRSQAAACLSSLKCFCFLWFVQVLLFFPSGAATPRTPLFLADAKELRRSSSPRHHRLTAGGEEPRRHNGWRAMAAHRRLVPRPHRESPPAHLVLVLVWFYSRYFMDGGYDADR